MAPSTVVWLRRDLRLSDNPALDAAVARGGPVVLAWVHAPEEEGESAPGAAARVFLHGALQSRRRRGFRARRPPRPAPRAFGKGAFRPRAGNGRGRGVRQPRAGPGVRVPGREGRRRPCGKTASRRACSRTALLFPPETLASSSGNPFRVFTPFWKRCLAQPPPAPPLAAPRAIPSPSRPPRSLSLAELGLLPSVPWDAGIRDAWPAGEGPAGERLSRFLDDAVGAYPDDRDRPGVEGTSRLSPYLHFGCIGRPAGLARGAVPRGGGRVPRRMRRAPRRSSGSWDGASSPITCSPIFRRRCGRPCTPGSPPSRGGRTPAASRRGGKAGPAIPWSMRGCASYGPPGGCTTGSG